MDLSSRLRAIVKSGPPRSVRELTYEPDVGGYEAALDLATVGAMLGGRLVETPFGQCLVIDRRYEADRFHGSVRIGECDVEDCAALRILDPSLNLSVQSDDRGLTPVFESGHRGLTPGRTIFIDLETTGLSGGAGTVAFLVGCGFFDLGAFQVRQFLLTSYAAERALLAAVAEFFDGADLIVTYNGKTFDVPMMETRWLFHRIRMPLERVAHFDMLHPARRLWKTRVPGPKAGIVADEGGCRLTTLERTLFDVARVGDVPGLEIPRRFFRFLRSGDPRPLEAVLEHNRLDLVSLAAVMARAMRLAQEGHPSCVDCGEALALGRVYEHAGAGGRSEGCYRRAAESPAMEIRAEALYRLGVRCRRDRRYAEAAEIWSEVIRLTESTRRRHGALEELRRCAAEALAVHQEHRERDFLSARDLALFAMDDASPRRADTVRHRLARLDRKIQKQKDAQQLSVL